MDKTVEPISSNTFTKLYVRLVGKDEGEKRILEIPQKEDPSDPTKKESEDSTQRGSFYKCWLR
jgi:hypothetical protein